MTMVWIKSGKILKNKSSYFEILKRLAERGTVVKSIYVQWKSECESICQVKHLRIKLHISSS